MEADNYGQACEYFRSLYSYVTLNVDQRNKVWTKKLEVCRDLDLATGYFKEFLIECKVESFEVQKQAAIKITELFDSHYWQYLKKSGSLDSRIKMYEQWSLTAELLEQLAADPHEWIGKSTDVQKLIVWIKEHLPGIEREKAELLSNYSEKQSFSDYIQTVGQLIQLAKTNSEALETEDIIGAVDNMMSRIYPNGLRWGSSDYLSRSDALKTAYNKYLASLKEK